MIIATGPIVVPNGLRGFLVRFYPYSGLADTNRLRAEAMELLGILRRELDSAGVPWVALQATNQSPGPKFGVFHVENYGFVVERHADGRWYRSGDVQPIPLTP